ncbi:MAG: uroporphyrinogen-III synthase [Gemmatimonadetes bacterium]|nr:uroporphyrinogen-III synthase [Gemmatimonadota bacterium]
MRTTDQAGGAESSPSLGTKQPLAGRRVIVTRPRAQAAEFVNTLETSGAEVIEFPTIRIIDPEKPEEFHAAVLGVDGFDWIVFTSVNGVERFWRELRRTGRDTESIAGISFCAIGPATAAAIGREGGVAELMPEEYVAEAVVEALSARSELRGARILLPRAAEARSVLPDSLRERGAEVVEVAAYQSVPDAAEANTVRVLLDRRQVDLITFTASSTVRNFVDAVGIDIGDALVASIGPITTATARDAGLSVQIEAAEYTVPGLMAAIVRHYAGARG